MLPVGFSETIVGVEFLSHIRFGSVLTEKASVVLPWPENPEWLSQLITDELEKLATAYEGSRDGWRAHGYYKGQSRDHTR